ncbi:hypothetical protein ACFOU2_22020 [Bacillus songklensis]|uniref:Uncharacterized protein n=1 Tax=Bacillus songklensis TaxID=1069116 RepID=A0ABV8B6X6_9BACI
MNRDEFRFFNRQRDVYIDYILNKYPEREFGEKRKQLLMKLEQWYNVAVKKFSAGVYMNLPNER